jgi:hypothetical protein
MATTTNYSWTTPDDTALVKDGAAAIRSLGSAIDTTVFNNANAAIAKTIVDAKGDIIAATAADTVARLAVGANDTVLTADSSTATGLKWGTVSAGGMTELASGSLSSTEVSLTSISGTYVNLYLILDAVSTNSNSLINIRLNNNSNVVYSAGGVRVNTLVGADFQSDAGSSYFSLSINAINNDNNEKGTFAVLIPNYASTTSHKMIESISFYNASGGQDQSMFSTGFFRPSTLAAVTSLQIRTNGTATFDSGTYKLYGVK